MIEKEMSKRAAALIALPFRISDRESTPIESLPDDCFGVIEKAFIYNLNETVNILTLPYSLTYQSTVNSLYSKILIAEKIRSANLMDRGMNEHDAYLVAEQTANERIEKMLNSDSLESTPLIELVILALNSLVESDHFSKISSTYLRQAVVMVWNAFEILTRDILEQVLNHSPSLIERLSKSDVVKRRIDLKTLVWENIGTHGFNLSEAMGSIIVSSQDFSDISSIKGFFRALLDGDQRNMKALAALDSRALYSLSKLRHLIVHRRGMIDQRFLAATDSKQSVGEEVEMSVQVIENFVRAVNDCGLQLLGSARHLLNGARA